MRLLMLRKKFIREKMDEDPALYKKFSSLIQQAIDDFRERRISDLEYLSKVSDIRDKVVSKNHEDVPDSISDNDEACAYYGAAQEYFTKERLTVAEEVTACMASSFQEAFTKENVVDFWNNQDAVNKVKGHMDDFFYDDLEKEHDVRLNDKQMDEIIKKTMQIAKSRRYTS